jgi:hypothetical protein
MFEPSRECSQLGAPRSDPLIERLWARELKPMNG